MEQGVSPFPGLILWGSGLGPPVACPGLPCDTPLLGVLQATIYVVGPCKGPWVLALTPSCVISGTVCSCPGLWFTIRIVRGLQTCTDLVSNVPTVV